MVRRAASAPLYDMLADSYDEHFTVAHRAAYDDLAWELVSDLLPPRPGLIVDVGCGSGRWTSRFAALGHRVVGVESSPAMAAAARHRLGPAVEVIGEPMESVSLPAGEVDLLVAMGSLQYADDPEAALVRLTPCLRPGGYLVVLVDSLVALVRELYSQGREEEALQRMRTGRGCWVQGELSAELHLMDSRRLGRALTTAGLVDVAVRGLLVGWSLLGRDEIVGRLNADRDAQMALERLLSGQAAFADLGKQLLGVGRQPASAGD